MSLITRRRALRAGAFTAAISLIASGLVTLGAGFAGAIDGAVSGTVFRDFNANGRYDTGHDPSSGVPDDVPLGGVTVTVYDALDNQLAQVTSGDDGTYEAATGRPNGTPVRVEFSNLPDGYFSSFQSSGPGIANGTSVQFTTIGQESIDFGALAPEEYNQGNPWMAIPLHIQGDPANDRNSVLPSIKLFETAESGDSYQPPVVATQGQTGSVWGTAWDSSKHTLYASAVYKRQSGLGPLGIGGIYRLPDLLDDDNEIADSPVVEPWLDVETLDIAGGGGKVDVGSVLSNSERKLNGHSEPAVDADAYRQAGKVGILGIAVSADGNTLYFLNGHDRNLYAVDISDPDVTPTEATLIELGLTGDDRPWAVETRYGQIFVGYTESGETLEPGTTAEEAHLAFAVIATPQASPGTWSTVLSAPLDYTRQPGDWFDDAVAAFRWNAWVDIWSWSPARNGVDTVSSMRINSSGDEYFMQVFPQAILSDITFDRDGYMVVTLMDRVAMQGGLRNYPTDDSEPQANHIARVLGDVLVAAPTGDGWELEHNGKVGDRVTEKSNANGNNEAAGPGGGEFIDDSATRNRNIEKELAFGSAAVPPGGTAVAVAGADVIDDHTNGVQWFDLHNGLRNSNNFTVSTNFSKAPGLGGIDDLALDAPVQIGNRVWFDADQNGRQDADEPAVAGVTAELRDASDTVLATTATNSDGEYYFSSTEVDGFVPGAEYSVTFVLPTNGGNLFDDDPRFGTVPWSSVGFTTQFSDSATPVNDSNADRTGRTGLFLVGGPGQNDHSIDAGLTANATLELRKELADSSAPALPGQTFRILVSAEDFRGDDVTLPDDGAYEVEAGGTHVITVPVGTTVNVTEDDSDPRIGHYVVRPSGAVLVGGDGSDRTIVTVTNTLERFPGTFSIVKEVSGEGSGVVGEDDVFTAEWATDPSGPWHEIAFGIGEPVGPDEDFQDGTVIYLRELTPPAIPNVVWGTPTYTNAEVENGIARFTIEGDEEIVVTIDNPTTGLGGFEVTKTVTGDGADLVADQEFTVEYTTTDSDHPSGELTVTPGAGARIDGLDIGTEVTLTEVAPSGPEWIQWGTPVFTGDGVADHGDGTATFEIGDLGTVRIGLENPATELTNQVRISKTVTGGGASAVPADAEFTVEYEWRAGDRTGSGVVKVRQDQAQTLSGIPRGATLTLAEVEFPALDGVSFGDVAWSGTGVTDNGNGTATLTIRGDDRIDLGLENTTELLQSGFSLSKVLAGTGADHVPAGTEFEIEYELDGVAQDPLFVSASQSVTIDGVDHNTTVTLTEVNLPDLPYIEWGTPVWTLNGERVDGDTVEFTINASNPVVVLELENTANLLTGGFSISKEVTGPGSGVFDTDLVFGGTYQWAGGEGDFAVKAGETWTLDEPLPAGTQVSISEVEPVGGLPDGYNWGTPQYRIDGGDPVDGPVTITIGDGTVIAVAIENPTTINTGRFTITKEVTGEDVVQDDFQFTGTYTYDGGSGEFAVQKDGTWTSPELPMGTVVTITELKPTGGLPDGYGWGTPQFLVDGEPVGESATITIGNRTAIDVTLRNPVTNPRIGIKKGDGVGDTIEHDADTVDDAQRYEPGETRTIVIRAQNTGDEDLQNVRLTDTTLSGADIQSLVWTFPDGTSAEAEFSNGVWTAQWDATFESDPAQSWAVGDWIIGHATLTVSDGAVPHLDEVVVEGDGRWSGVHVTDDDRYHAFTAAIQLIKYDGEKPDPQVQDGGDWVTPIKPMEDPYQDANDTDHAVKYPINEAQRVRMVATNTGHTWLTQVFVSDTTDVGPYDVKHIVADLSPLGGPAQWSFTDDGPWMGPWEPGTSFFLEGELTLPADSVHTDTAVITAVVVRPGADDDGVPTGEPALDDSGAPIVALDDNGDPWTLTDNDPFNAYTGSLPPLPNTGVGSQPWPLALILLAAGVGMLALTRFAGAGRGGRHRVEPSA